MYLFSKRIILYAYYKEFFLGKITKQLSKKTLGFDKYGLIWVRRVDSQQVNPQIVLKYMDRSARNYNIVKKKSLYFTIEI